MSMPRQHSLPFEPRQESRRAAAPKVEDRDWFTTTEAAAVAEVSDMTVRRWCSAKKPFASRVGGRWRVNKALFSRFLSNGMSEEGEQENGAEGHIPTV